MEKIANCGDDGYYIKDGLEMCSKIYKDWLDYRSDNGGVFGCAERCTQQKLADQIVRGRTHTCKEIQEQALYNLTICYSSMCYKPGF